ncbi:hypothetical protein MHUMG1_07786 [Metarhizium humberi]|uniref:Uncharacterized protein n=1 Tax=Metarhizium humberi TaxID=2596975 RepID=A0A9P8S4C6_9HYPO|nr:hypothetical protein MHUMG1_07786 [Metarhizium humberi]
MMASSQIALLGLLLKPAPVHAEPPSRPGQPANDPPGAHGAHHPPAAQALQTPRGPGGGDAGPHAKIRPVVHLELAPVLQQPPAPVLPLDQLPAVHAPGQRGRADAQPPERAGRRRPQDAVRDQGRRRPGSSPRRHRLPRGRDAQPGERSRRQRAREHVRREDDVRHRLVLCVRRVREVARHLLRICGCE